MYDEQTKMKKKKFYGEIRTRYLHVVQKSHVRGLIHSTTRKIVTIPKTMGT